MSGAGDNILGATITTGGNLAGVGVDAANNGLSWDNMNNTLGQTQGALDSMKNAYNSQNQQNTEVLKGETIITSCAGCYKTLKEDYEGLDVVHISQLLDDLIKQNKLNFSKKDLNVTFHDSCHLARHMNVFDEPRSVIESVADLVEMENSRENALCCGAGGGVKSAYPEIAQEMAENRISQAKDTNSSMLITTCPFCKLNLKNEDIEVLDLTEFLMEYGGIDEE